MFTIRKGEIIELGLSEIPPLLLLLFLLLLGTVPAGREDPHALLVLRIGIARLQIRFVDADVGIRLCADLGIGRRLGTGLTVVLHVDIGFIVGHIHDGLEHGCLLVFLFSITRATAAAITVATAAAATAAAAAAAVAATRAAAAAVGAAARLAITKSSHFAEFERPVPAFRRFAVDFVFFFFVFAFVAAAAAAQVQHVARLLLAVVFLVAVSLLRRFHFHLIKSRNYSIKF